MPIINSQIIPRVWFTEPDLAAEDSSGPTSQYPRHGQRWTQVEINHAVVAVKSGTTICALASTLGRKPTAVDSALQKKLGRFYRVRFNIRFDSSDGWVPSETDRTRTQYPREGTPWHPDEVTYVIRESQDGIPLRDIAMMVGRRQHSVDALLNEAAARYVSSNPHSPTESAATEEQSTSRNTHTMVMRQMLESIPRLPPSDAVAYTDMRQYQTIDEIATVPAAVINHFFSPRTREYEVPPVTQTDTQIKLFAVAKLSGMALNWAVVKAAGLNPNFDINEPVKHGHPAGFRDGNGQGDILPYFELDWSASINLILSEDISFRVFKNSDVEVSDVYFAKVCCTPGITVYWTSELVSKGSTALEASLRCYVKVKLGAHVSLPPELQ